MSLTPIELQVLLNQSTEISRIASFEHMQPSVQMQMYQEFFRKLTEDKQKMVNSSPTSSEDSVKTDEKEQEISQQKNNIKKAKDMVKGKGRYLDLHL